MNIESKTVTSGKSLRINRVGYALFILLALYFLIVSRDVISAASNLGIGLVFDPFDDQITWNKRAKWQRAVHLVHLVAVFVLFGLGLYLQ